MELLETQLSAASSAEMRLSGLVRYSDGATEGYWFTFPCTMKPPTSGNPWLACLLPLAVQRGEDLALCHPVDPEMLYGARCLMLLWRTWYPHLPMIRVQADTAVIEERPPDSIALFSGGVDSYFTAMRHPETRHYLNVLGFDMPLRKRDAYERNVSRLDRVAGEWGAHIIRMSTNLRETRWGKAPWESFCSGGALAGAGLVLERNFGRVLIPAAFDYTVLGWPLPTRTHPHPWGYHPVSDPLYSTSRCQISHDGGGHSRIEKTQFITESSLVRATLHVCYKGSDGKGQDDTNCCRCAKCYRTMAVLDIIGRLNDCALFDASTYDVRKIADVYTGSLTDRLFFLDIRRHALEHGRHDIVEQVNRSLRRSAFVLQFDRLVQTPLLWRLRRYVRRHALSGLVGQS